MISIIAFTRSGCALGRLLAEKLEGVLYAPERFAAEFSALPCGDLSCWTREQFERKSDLIFVSAAGIAVRSIAPWIQDKLTDPAVVSVDEKGRYAVPLLSGHVGGANVLARRVAAITGGTPVISTATDLSGVFAVDLWAVENSLVMVERELAKEISAALLAGEPVGFRSRVPVSGPLPEGVVEQGAELGFLVGEDTGENPFPRTLHLLPKDLLLGLGCRKGISSRQLEKSVNGVFQDHHLDLRRVCRAGTIDLKREEQGLLDFCGEQGWPLSFFSAQELAEVEGTFRSSDFVRKTTGVDNVCERSAVRLGGELLVPKQAGDGVTVAVARREFSVRFESE